MFKIKLAKHNDLRRLSIKPDKEGKSRPFAIFDYISQSVLTPTHDSIYKILKGIPQDSTFDQNEGFRSILYGGYSFYASFDLTSATDRFPLDLQVRIMAYLYGSQMKADA
jgi:hypothetical protein